jgi:solute carrier family 25 thiamine pyrophosphate transporter 19
MKKYELGTSSSEFVAGAVAGSIATTITYPFDLLRTRFAAQGKIKIYSSLSNAILQIYKVEGFLGFYRGLVPTLAQIFPMMGSIFSTYGFLKRNLIVLENNEKSFGIIKGFTNIACGGIAGMVGKTLVMPFDIIRKRLQVQGPHRNKYFGYTPIYDNLNIIGIGKNIVRNEGFFALWKG